MTRIILVRHGRSDANDRHVFAGIYDTPLSPLGHEQAKAVAAYLSEHEKIDKIYTSDLGRVYHTVLPTAEALGLTPIKDKGLREINGGLWECLSFDDLATYYKDDFSTWNTNTAGARPTGGESVREVYERIVAHVRMLAEENEGKTILIGSHWTPIRALLAHVLTGTHESIYTPAEPPEVKNASLHVLGYESGVFSPIEIGITSHLDLLKGK